MDCIIGNKLLVQGAHSRQVSYLPLVGDGALWAIDVAGPAAPVWQAPVRPRPTDGPCWWPETTSTWPVVTAAF